MYVAERDIEQVTQRQKQHVVVQGNLEEYSVVAERGR